MNAHSLPDPTDLSLTGCAGLDSYRAMLTALLETGLPSLTLREAALQAAPGDRWLGIRHDVSQDVDKALAMGRIEHALGVRATYFLAPPGATLDNGKRERDTSYYGVVERGRLVQSARLREAAQEFAALGHEVAISSEFIDLARRIGRPLVPVLLEQIAFFRGAGVEVVGVAALGLALARDEGDDNAIALALGALGLSYDAALVRADLVVSDFDGRLQVGSRVHARLEAGALPALLGSPRKVLASLSSVTWRLRARPGNVVAETRPMPPFMASGAQCAGTESDVTPGARARSEALDMATPLAGTPDGPVFMRADGKPFRVAVRGDCCSRRAVSMNKAVFPNGFQLIVNEKSPNHCFVDTLRGLHADAAEVRALVDVDAMPGSLRHYFDGQFERSVLESQDLDLLVMDSYSDMNFELWRHRAAGWSIWIHPKYLRDPADFAARFDKLGYESLDAAADAICAVVDHVRERNPGLPVMFLDQPVEYYPKLDKRREFHDLGKTVAERQEGVYAARTLLREELVPADVGSCGPGMTLHFDGPTYLRMMRSAWDAGLGIHLRDGHPPHRAGAAPLPAQATSAGESAPSAHLSAPIHEVASDGLPRVDLGYGEGRQGCLGSCAAQVDSAQKTFAEYFLQPHVDAGAAWPRFTPMLISTEDFRDFAAWEAHIKTFGNGARLRQKRKALAQNFYVKPFAWKLFIPDVHEINHSKETRSGGAMRGTYLRSVEDMGGAPDRLFEPVMPACPTHWAMTFGTFVRDEGRLQGSVRVDERLLAYISLRRCGDVVLYSQILGHGDFLNQGALVLLHHEVIRWLSEHRESFAHDLRFVMYGGAQNGGESLLQFKRQAGFSAHHVVAMRRP